MAVDLAGRDVDLRAVRALLDVGAVVLLGDVGTCKTAMLRTLAVLEADGVLGVARAGRAVRVRRQLLRAEISGR